MISWWSSKTERRTSRIQGRGLFARETITAGEIVAVKGGSIVDRAALAALGSEVVSAAMQVEDDLYIAPSIAADVDGSMLYLNHSCEPNVGLRGQITFVAMSDISPGCELTIDYATIYADSSKQMRCSCGTPQCRGLITGNDWRSPDLQRRYAGFFSSYIDAHIAGVTNAGAGLTLDRVPGTYAICRVAPGDSLPGWIMHGAFFSVSRTPTELSAVCDMGAVPVDVNADGPWSMMAVRGPLDLNITGVLAGLATPLATAGISLFAVSTYDTDYVLVRSHDMDRATRVLRAAGHSISEDTATRPFRA